MESLYNYKCGYSDGYEAARSELKKQIRERRATERCRWLYFFEQKTIGLLMILLTVLVVVVSRDGTIALVLLPVAVYMLCTKEKMIIKGEYKDGV